MSREVVPRNAYLVLGVLPTVSAEDLKSAYRELARQHHPDRNPDDAEAAAARLREVSAAHDAVTDATRRKAHDAPWMRLRVPKGLVMGEASKPPGLLGRLFGMRPKDGPGSLYFTHMESGLTCFQYAGFKLVSQAEVEFRRALEIQPTSLEARFNLAVVCHWLGRYDEARTLLDAVVSAVPEDRVAAHLASTLRAAP